MPQKGKNKYCQYDRSCIGEALEKINAKELSIKGASREYNVPYSTLRDRLTGRVIDGVKNGSPTVLTDQEETDLSQYLIKCADLGVGKTRKQVMEMAYMCIYHDPTRNKTAELWLANRTAGKDWYYSFMKRHTELSLRKPERLSKCRAKMTNEAILSNFYDVIESIVTVDGTDIEPHTIFNCDEVGVGLDFRPSKVVASRKAHSLWSVNSGDKTNITVLACGAADGIMCPPMVIYKGLRENKVLKETAPDGWLVKFSPSGWINSVLFEQWFEELFIPYVNTVRDSVAVKVVLLLDGHSSHETLHMIEKARQNNIVILCLPPNTTHLLQPLDA